MRVDKYLKESRILKRRTTAKDLANGERVFVNGRQAKPATTVNVGDEVHVQFGIRHIIVKVLDTNEHHRKEEASLMYEIVKEYKDKEDEIL